MIYTSNYNNNICNNQDTMDLTRYQKGTSGGSTNEVALSPTNTFTYRLDIK